MFLSEVEKEMDRNGHLACDDCKVRDGTVAACEDCGRLVCVEHDFVPANFGFDSDSMFCQGECMDRYYREMPDGPSEEIDQNIDDPAATVLLGFEAGLQEKKRLHDELSPEALQAGTALPNYESGWAAGAIIRKAYVETLNVSRREFLDNLEIILRDWVEEEEDAE